MGFTGTSDLRTTSLISRRFRRGGRLLTRRTVRRWTIGVSRARARIPSAPVVFAGPTPWRWRSETGPHMHTASLRLRNDYNLVALVARDENRYPHKYQGSYQSPAP